MPRELFLPIHPLLKHPLTGGARRIGQLALPGSAHVYIDTVTVIYAVERTGSEWTWKAEH